jgi:phosphatidylcholine synthase
LQIANSGLDPWQFENFLGSLGYTWAFPTEFNCEARPMTDAEVKKFPRKRVLAAWGVHLYTALGLPLMFFAAVNLIQNFGNESKDPRMFFILIWVAIVVDATDGFLARRVKVKEVLPTFSGRRLDDLVDFLSFAFLPCVFMYSFELLPKGWEFMAIFPLMASAYGFCQEAAKTDDAFVGFPSYWNIMVLYLYILETSPWVNVGIIAFLSMMVFVPIHYIYPSRTRFMMPLTVTLGSIWGIAMITLSVYPKEEWSQTVTWLSLFFPIYYTVLSFVHHWRIHKDHDEKAAAAISVDTPENQASDTSQTPSPVH